jgi:osmotically-inducible protein OsmY
MNSKKGIPVIVAAALLGSAALGPIAVAEENDHSTEQRGAKTEANVKDAWLHGKLEATLLFNEHLNSFAIDSDVKGGTAYLRGAVESSIDRDLAGEIAKSIDGITSVKNELVVDKTMAETNRNSESSKEREGFKQSVLNATLTARIKSKLLMNSNTAGMDINVDSNNGMVTLSGEVASDQERELAVRLAENTSGATTVHDRLMIEDQEESE